MTSWTATQFLYLLSRSTCPLHVITAKSTVTHKTLGVAPVTLSKIRQATGQTCVGELNAHEQVGHWYSRLPWHSKAAGFQKFRFTQSLSLEHTSNRLHLQSAIWASTSKRKNWPKQKIMCTSGQPSQLSNAPNREKSLGLSRQVWHSSIVWKRASRSRKSFSWLLNHRG